mmetsp:Transcript_88451/g.258539  ORF Transcript_88451/g.258539 Transcript_88451/m.258539 type:complete len:136 (+) Transcript_88451:259-666(+)
MTLAMVVQQLAAGFAALSDWAIVVLLAARDLLRLAAQAVLAGRACALAALAAEFAAVAAAAAAAGNPAGAAAAAAADRPGRASAAASPLLALGTMTPANSVLALGIDLQGRHPALDFPSAVVAAHTEHPRGADVD